MKRVNSDNGATPKGESLCHTFGTRSSLNDNNCVVCLLQIQRNSSLCKSLYITIMMVWPIIREYIEIFASLHKKAEE